MPEAVIVAARRHRSAPQLAAACAMPTRSTSPSTSCRRLPPTLAALGNTAEIDDVILGEGALMAAV